MLLIGRRCGCGRVVILGLLVQSCRERNGMMTVEDALDVILCNSFYSKLCGRGLGFGSTYLKLKLSS